tara:strand:- start:675 stop:815 length:141 start_codon:yes stop_codon:yes gene_type:complete
MPRRKRSKLKQMLNAIDKLLSSHGERNIREDIKNKKRKTRKKSKKE